MSQAFIGTWEWRSGTDVFRIVLRRDPAYRMPDGTPFQVILGRHSYTRNGVLLEESITQRPDVPQARTLFGFPREEWDLEMAFRDLTKNKSADAQLTISPATPNQLRFELREKEGIYVNRPVPPAGFTVPTPVTLTRVP